VENGGEISDALIAKIIPRIRTTDEEFKKELENLKRKFEKYGYI